MEVKITAENYNEVLNQELPVVIDFYATWCVPCKKVASIMSELAEEFDGKAIIAKANIEEVEDITAQYRVVSVPTVVFLKNGKEVARQTGAAPKSNFVDKINAML